MKTIFFDSVYKTTWDHKNHCIKDQERYNRMRVKYTIGNPNRDHKWYTLCGLSICITLETELVPSHVDLAIGALDYDDSGWKSKWSGHPNFGKRIS